MSIEFVLFVFQKSPIVSDEFLQAQDEIQRQRVKQVQQTCDTLYHQIPLHDIIKDPPYEILVDDRHKLAYCTIPKVASTSWKRVWLVLTGLANSTDQYSQQVVNNEFYKNDDGMRHLSKYPPEWIKIILANYTKFMFTRHPLSRVLSAFRNKLAPDSNFRLREKWQRKLGFNIISRYRKEFDPRYADVNFTMEHYDLTFAEFVRYLTDMKDNRASFNKHWMEMYAQCFPCAIQYDYLGKYETLLTDAKYILHKAKVDDIVEFPSFNGSSPTNSSSVDTLISYYSQVPWTYIEQLLIRFNVDIKLFDYGPYPAPKDKFLSWLKRTAKVHL